MPCPLRSLLLVPLLAASGLPAAGGEPVRVVTSLADHADFVRQIGGDKVEVHALLSGRYDPHFFEPTPSEVIRLRKADLLVVAGMEVDAFIPGLIQAARQPRIRFGGEGFVDPSRGVRALGVPEGPIDASLGDVHPHGNPHCWMVPENIRIAGENILAGLIRAAPEHEETFRANLRAYLEEVDRRFKVWEARLAPHQGTRVLQFHESWNYLLGHFGFEIAGSVEPKPGIAPSAAHLRRLVDQIRRDEIRLVLAEPFYSERPLRFLHQQTGIGVLRLPLYLGGDPRYTTVLDNLGGIVDQIAAALDDPKTAGPGE